MRSAVIALLVVVCTALPAPVSAQRGTVKLSTQSPLSGDLAALGEGIKLAAQLAVDRLKEPIEKAGFRVELAPFDDQARPDVGVTNAKAIIADSEILAVVGHLTGGVTLPASEVYKDVGLAMISPAATDPLVTDRGLPNVSRVCGRDDVQAAVAAQFAHDTLKARTVYIVHTRSPYGRTIGETFQDHAKRLGVQVLGFESTDERTSFGPLLRPIKAKNPALLFFAGEYPQAAPLFRQARDEGIAAPLMGPDGLDSSELLTLAGEAVIGMHYTTVAGPIKEYPKAREFADEYRRRYGKEPEAFAAHAYDAAAIALKAVATAIREGRGQPATREAVARAVRKIRHAGITANIEFDEHGDPRKAKYFVIQVAREWKDNKTVKRLEIEAPPVKK
jgi:ABC-type branched-subunit amino acid transport system substrate-binding protein